MAELLASVRISEENSNLLHKQRFVDSQMVTIAQLQIHQFPTVPFLMFGTTFSTLTRACD